MATETIVAMIAMMEIAAPYRCPCLAIKLSAFEAKIFESRAALRFDVLLLLDLHHAENTLCAVFDNGDRKSTRLNSSHT